jgi:hypothetical protein
MFFSRWWSLRMWRWWWKVRWEPQIHQTVVVGPEFQSLVLTVPACPLSDQSQNPHKSIPYCWNAFQWHCTSQQTLLALPMLLLLIDLIKLLDQIIADYLSWNHTKKHHHHHVSKSKHTPMPHKKRKKKHEIRNPCPKKKSSNSSSKSSI